LVDNNFPVSQEWSKQADKANLLTASGMLLHAFPSAMSVSSLREFPENCVYKQVPVYDKYRLLHGIFHIIPFISPRSYQPESRYAQGMI
jgi:hypothetical protein